MERQVKIQAARTSHRAEIQEVFQSMKEIGLATTMDSFSSDWLGMHWSYYRAMGERTTIAPLMTLWKRLTDAGEIDLAQTVFRIVVKRADSGTGVPRPDRMKSPERAHVSV